MPENEEHFMSVRAGCRCLDSRTAVENDRGFPPYPGPPRGGGIRAYK